MAATIGTGRMEGMVARGRAPRSVRSRLVQSQIGSVPGSIKGLPPADSEVGSGGVRCQGALARFFDQPSNVSDRSFDRSSEDLDGEYQVNVRRGVLVGIALLVGWGGVAGASGSSSAPITAHLDPKSTTVNGTLVSLSRVVPMECLCRCRISSVGHRHPAGPF
jgi:hypothetical protein